jgi:hypothetical protein
MSEDVMILSGIYVKLKILAAGILGITCFLPVFAQNPIISEYQAKTGEYAGLYSGQIKPVYNIFYFDNHPFYKSNELADATLIYDGNTFYGQKIRLDLYKEELSLKSPEKNYNIIVDSEKVDTVYAWNETIIRLKLPEKSGLSKGFYSLLFDGRRLQLLFKAKCVTSRVVIDKLEKRRFMVENRYYLCFSGQYYPVKNKNSFTKLFPQYKKQINRFSKERKLDFRNETRQSLTLLAQYCEELLQSDKKL